MPEQGWTYENPLHFTFNIRDTNKVYDLWVEIDHTTDFETQNLYTKLYTSFPDGRKTEKVVSLELASKAGAWQGACSNGSCKLRVPLQAQAYFNQTGEYTLTAEQYMRQDSLEGISAFRFMIEDTGKVVNSQ